MLRVILLCVAAVGIVFSSTFITSICGFNPVYDARRAAVKPVGLSRETGFSRRLAGHESVMGKAMAFSLKTHLLRGRYL